MAILKISDLSVGDWVEFHRTRGIYIAPPLFDHANAQVIGTHRGAEVSLLVDGKREFIAIPLSAIRPIPITAEILERNGLCVVEQDANFCEYELFGSENFSLFHTKGTLRYRLETPQASVVCWFIHELQHALRLAGVDKEINL